MLKWIVALVLGLALLSGASPWPGPVVMHGPGLEWAGGLLTGLLALGITLGALAAVGFGLFFVLGSALLLAIGLPLLIVCAVVALIFAPILIPVLVVFMLFGVLIKGLAVCAA